MRSANILRASIFAVAAAFLIFNQDHSISVGTTAIQFVTAGIAFGGLVLIKTESTSNRSVIIVPSAIAAFVLGLTFLFSSGGTAESNLAVFTGFIAILAGGTAIAEFVFSRQASGGDKLELRISSAIGILAAIVFWLAPLDALNAVGFFSAYLSVSAVQLAIWAAAPKKKEQ
jgi:hypothetical protein